MKLKQLCYFVLVSSLALPTLGKRFDALYRRWPPTVSLRSTRVLFLFSRFLDIATRRLPITGLILVLRKDLEGLSAQYQATASVSVSIASESDVEAAALLQDAKPHLVMVYASRLRRGNKCFVAKIDGDVIASNWLIFRAEVDDSDFTVVRPGEVVCSDAYTAPAWRGRGVHTALLAHMIQWASNAGYKKAYTEVAAVHRASWITHHRLGWEIILVAVKIQVGRSKRDRLWLFGSRSHPLRGQFLGRANY